MLVKTGVAEGEPVSLETAEQHPEDRSLQVPTSLTRTRAWLRKWLMALLKRIRLGHSPGEELRALFDFLCISWLIS